MSLKAYDEYVDSGDSMLGLVPSHWRVCPLKAVVEIDNSGCYGVDPDFSIIKLPVATTAQISSLGKFNVVDMPLRGFSKEEVDKYACSPGDVLVVKSSGSATNIISGKSGIVDDSTGIFVFSNFLLRLRSRLEFIYPNFLYRVISSELTRSRVQLMCSSTTYPNLKVGEYVAANIPLPTLNEQLVIAKFLDRETAKIDALIAEQEKLIALLAEKRQATIFRAVTRGLDPNVSLKDSGVQWLGKVPTHWEVVPLKYLVTLRSGGTPSKENLEYWNGEVPWASAKDMKLEELYDTEDHITEKALEIGAACTVPAGSVLVVVRGMILARLFPVCQVMTPMAINQDLKAVLPGERLAADFLPWLLRGSAQESLRRLDEAGHGTKALRMDAWTSMQLPVPPLAEQRVIAEKLRHKLKLLAMLSEEAVNSVNILKERRAALISAAVTGKIDVRGLAA